jgi:hypothetical protein
MLPPLSWFLWFDFYMLLSREDTDDSWIPQICHLFLHDPSRKLAEAIKSSLDTLNHIECLACFISGNQNTRAVGPTAIIPIMMFKDINV